MSLNAPRVAGGRVRAFCLLSLVGLVCLRLHFDTQFDELISEKDPVLSFKHTHFPSGIVWHTHEVHRYLGSNGQTIYDEVRT